MIAEPITIETGQGPAAVRIHHPDASRDPDAPGPRGTIVLGHGAGGGLGSWPKDLQSVLHATAHGWTVVLVEQPWRVAGRKVATRPPTLDAAWVELVPALPLDPLPRPLVVGGRSAGARVACRTSPGHSATGLPRADGVLCLAFPLHPPGRPEASRAPELQTPVRLGIPTLVVQGRADAFGTPQEVATALSEATGSGAGDPTPDPTAGGPVTLVDVPGSHSPSRDQARVTSAVLSWLEQLG